MFESCDFLGGGFGGEGSKKGFLDWGCERLPAWVESISMAYLKVPISRRTMPYGYISEDHCCEGSLRSSDANVTFLSSLMLVSR